MLGLRSSLMSVQNCFMVSVNRRNNPRTCKQHPSKRCKRRCCRFSRNNRGTPSNTCPPRFHGQCLEDQEEPILWNHRRNEKKRNENPSVYSLCHLNVGWILRILSPFSSSTSSKRLDDEENDKRILLLFPSLFLIGGHSL